MNGAALNYPDLQGANLLSADLSGAHPTGSNLYHASLDGAIICKTTMPDGSRGPVTSLERSSGSDPLGPDKSFG